MEFNEVQHSLKTFSENHSLLQRVVDSCRIAIKNSLIENPEEGFPLDQTEMKFDKQEFVFNHQFFNKSYVKTQIKLYRRALGVLAEEDSENYGYYILYTDEKGNNFDDSLVYNNDTNGT